MCSLAPPRLLLSSRTAAGPGSFCWVKAFLCSCLCSASLASEVLVCAAAACFGTGGRLHSCVCLWLFPECGVTAAESKSSGNFDPLGNASASASQPAGLDTQPLQSSASLDSSSVLHSPSTSFEPIKPDPTGSEYAPLFHALLQKHAAWSEGKAARPGGRS